MFCPVPPSVEPVLESEGGDRLGSRQLPPILLCPFGTPLLLACHALVFRNRFAAVPRRIGTACCMSAFTGTLTATLTRVCACVRVLCCTSCIQCKLLCHGAC
jgi:hypothetical protein